MPIIDFAIVTALLEEFKVLVAQLPLLQEPISENQDLWYRARLKGANGRNYEIVAAFQSEMGPLEAESLTSRIIQRWDPAYIILTGIAGSFHKDVDLGDVIVSQQVFYYDLGKIARGKIKYRPQGYPCSVTLIRQAEGIRVDHQLFRTWQRACRQSAIKKVNHLGKSKKLTKAVRTKLQAHSPKLHFGTVASGSLVIADKEKRKELLLLHGKIIGTEMEGAGLLHAAFSRETPTPAILIKGISDAADRNKDREDAKGYWRELAAENPVRLALQLIASGRIKPLQTDDFVLDATLGSLDQARGKIPESSANGSSYLSFPNLVLPKGPLTGLSVTVKAYNSEGQLVALEKVILEYEDLDGNSQTKRMTSAEQSIQIHDAILPTPMGVFLLVLGTAQKIEFCVKGTRNEQTITWFASPN